MLNEMLEHTFFIIFLVGCFLVGLALLLVGFHEKCQQDYDGDVPKGILRKIFGIAFICLSCLVIYQAIKSGELLIWLKDFFSLTFVSVIALAFVFVVHAIYDNRT